MHNVVLGRCIWIHWVSRKLYYLTFASLQSLSDITFHCKHFPTATFVATSIIFYYFLSFLSCALLDSFSQAYQLQFGGLIASSSGRHSL